MKNNIYQLQVLERSFKNGQNGANAPAQHEYREGLDTLIVGSLIVYSEEASLDSNLCPPSHMVATPTIALMLPSIL